jgi:hypothetical protein
MTPVAKGLLLAVALWLGCATPGWAVVLSTQTVSQFFGDDINSSTLYGTGATNPAVPQAYTSQCPWVNFGLSNAGYTNANGWNFTWAGAATDANMMGDLSYTLYTPWVVQVPVYNDPNGGSWGGSFPPDPSGTKYEAGGAEIILSFNPKNNANDPLNAANLPAGATVHWIQAYAGTAYGATDGNASGNLDGASGNPALGTGKPFYDQNSAAGVNNGVYYFADTPGNTEAEYETNPVADVQFQVFLAVDVPGNGLMIGGNTITDNVTIYGGYWWGFQYNAIDAVPEPCALFLFGSGAIGLCAYAWRQRTKAT